MQIIMDHVRQQAIDAMRNELRIESELVESEFELLVRCSFRLANFTDQNMSAALFLLLLAKATNLTRSCATLVIDGFGQEAGAILRLWVEAIELIRYLVQDISRVQEVFENRLPSAGLRAKAIGGDFHNLRRFLNENSSHFAFTPASLGHIFDPATGVIVTEPAFSLKVLRANLIMLFTFTYFTAFEIINATGAAGVPNEDLLQTWYALKVEAMPIIMPRETAG